MKRLALCVDNLEDYLHLGSQYSLVLINSRMDKEVIQRIIKRAGCDVVIDQDGVRHIGNGTEHQDEAMVFTTSGSTGEVKLCAFTRAQVDIKIRQLCDWFELSANDRYVNMVPLWTTYAMSFYLAARHVGMQIDFVDAKNIRSVPNYNPTLLVGTPRLLQILSSTRMSELRFVRSATEPMTPAQHQQFKEAFGTKIMNSYGMTEAFGTCLTVPLQGEYPPGIAGLPFGMEARIDDGKLHLQGPTFFQPGWYATGDLAYQDNQGYYVIQGRIKDLISINGAKIAPAVVEKMLIERHPKIGDVVVFGKDTVNVLYDGDCDANDLVKDIRSLCLGYRPTLVQRVDAIPTTAAGKVSRSNLAQVFNAN
jgi:acyl-coenzyme A synthetase/AMP-(fatty) acid ligase